MWYLFTGRFRLTILKGQVTRTKMSERVKSKKKTKAAVKEGRLASCIGFVHAVEYMARLSVGERFRLMMSLVCRRKQQCFLTINISLFPRCCWRCAAALSPPHLVRPGEKRAALEDSGKMKHFFHWLWHKNNTLNSCYILCKMCYFCYGKRDQLMPDADVFCLQALTVSDVNIRTYAGIKLKYQD